MGFARNFIIHILSQPESHQGAPTLACHYGVYAFPPQNAFDYDTIKGTMIDNLH